jgi:hypothetical protein
VTILIIEFASVVYASQSKPTREEALDQAYSQYCASSTPIEVIKQFFAPLAEYSMLQLTEFIL